MSAGTAIRSGHEGGDLVWRAYPSATEVLRISDDGITFPNQVISDPWIFDVTAEAYGAAGDGVTNDTVAINLAVAAAFAYAQSSGTFFAVVYFPAGVYLLSSATTKGGTTKGNAQIPIPIQDNDARKVTLVFRGPGDASAMPYWEQDAGSRWGATLKTTLTGLTTDSNWGIPSVIGGPATSGTLAEYDGNDFNNVLVVIDGIGISTPVDPSMTGFDFGSTAELIVESAAVVPDYSSTGPGTGLQGTATHDATNVGMITPRHTNNDLLIIRNFTVYGCYTGLTVGEHAWVERIAAIYCHDGLVLYAQQGNIHSSAFGAISIEACENGIWCIAGDENGYPIHVAAVSFETIAGNHIKDPNNALCGEVHLTKLDGPTGISVSGGDNVRILAANQARGPLTAPSVPATTVVLQNPFWVDCDVLLTGGTVTQVHVDGVTTGLTDAAFPAFVPLRSGGTITLTYSSAPTWKWWGR